LECPPLRPFAALLAASIAMAPAVANAASGSDGAQLRSGWRDDYRRPLAVPYPADNPYSVAKAALGAALFFDPVLSGSRSTACVTCHQPSLAWGDSLARAIGDRQQPMALRSPTLLDAAWIPLLGWDGRFPDVESVTFQAILSEENMDLPAHLRASHNCGTKCHVPAFEEGVETAETPRDGFRASWLVAA